MEIEQAIGEELKACRQKKGISQEQLGFDAGVHRTYVSLIEVGGRSPTLAVLFRLCKALDISPADFVKKVQLRMERRDRKSASR